MKLVFNLILLSALGLGGGLILACIIVSPLVLLVYILSKILPDPKLTIDQYDSIQYKLYKLDLEHKVSKAVDKINKKL